MGRKTRSDLNVKIQLSVVGQRRSAWAFYGRKNFCDFCLYSWHAHKTWEFPKIEHWLTALIQMKLRSVHTE